MVETTAFAIVEWLPRPGSWEEAVNPYQTPTATDMLAGDVMTDRETGSPQRAGIILLGSLLCSYSQRPY